MRVKHPIYEPLLRWARSQPAIRAVVITGSLARADGSVDQYSDLDAQIISRDITSYIADDSWLDGLGKVWIRFPMNDDLPYRLVWFAEGHKVDFQFIALDEIRADLREGRLNEEYQRGYIVALDKDGLYRSMPPSPRSFPPPPEPEAAEILAVINEFWFEAIHVAQFIRRREFWVVKWRDWTMKRNLLRLLEWHAQARGDGQANTWLLGKRINDWADAEALENVKAIWRPWEAEALWRGLLTQMALFRRLSRELCIAREIACDDDRHQEIQGYIRRMKDEDRAEP